MSALKIEELIKLSTLGIAPTSFRFNSLSLQSDKFICVKEEGGEKPQLTIIDLSNPSSPRRFPMKAQAALIHRTDGAVVVLRTPTVMQVLHLQQKQVLAKQALTETVEFWCWIKDDQLAVVTSTAVYHWNISSNEYTKMFDRDPALAGHRIIDYQIADDGEWAVIAGIAGGQGQVTGQIQLHSFQHARSRVLPGHAASFCNWQQSPKHPKTTVLCFAGKSGAAAQVHMIEVGPKKDAAGNPLSGFAKRSQPLALPPAHAAADFPLALRVASRYGLSFVLTKMGYLFVHDIGSGTCLHQASVCGRTLFVSAPSPAHPAAEGIVGVTADGTVLRITLDRDRAVNFVTSRLGQAEVAFELAQRGGLSGADQLFRQRFEGLFSRQQYKAAAEVVLSAPDGVLRIPATLQRFSHAPPTPGQPHPLIQYFSGLMEAGERLNELESVELCRRFVERGKTDTIVRFLKEEKLSYSEELGDLVKSAGMDKQAVAVYMRAGAHEKALVWLVEHGQFGSIVEYARRSSYTPDYVSILRQVVTTTPDKASEFANSLLHNPEGPLLSLDDTVTLFVENGLAREGTSFLVDACKAHDFSEETADLQTRILEINLASNPAVADTIMSRNRLVHFDHARIALLCERAGLYQRAIQLTEDHNERIRLLAAHTAALPVDWYAGWAITLEPEEQLEIHKAVLSAQPIGHANHVSASCAQAGTALDAQEVISMFQQNDATEGLFHYLSAILPASVSPEVHFSFLETAVQLDNLREIERVCRDSQYLDGQKAFDFLKEATLSSYAPLLTISQRFDLGAEVTQFLFKRNQLQVIEKFATSYAPEKAHQVVSALLAMDGPEDFVRRLLMELRDRCDVDGVVEICADVGRLRLVRPMLEARLRAGNTDGPTHTGFGKVLVDANDSNGEKFLRSDPYYDHASLGKYCEKRHPSLAFLSYATAAEGACDEEMIGIANSASLFKELSRTLVQRKDPALWAMALDEANEHRDALVDQVVSGALSDVDDMEAISIAVRAFMGMPTRLLELLEKIVLQETHFSNTPALQNLLILTAVKNQPDRVSGYIQRLDAYDPVIIAEALKTAELFDEAVEVYRRCERPVDAARVLVQHSTLEQAAQFAQQVSLSEVWALLGQAQLSRSSEEDQPMAGVEPAIKSFLKAQEPAQHVQVIRHAKQAQAYAPLIDYLRMCRDQLSAPSAQVDTELVYALARLDRLGELEDLILSPNAAHVQEVGDRCFSEELYHSARLLFASISNWASLASCFVRLGEFRQALDTGRKANHPRTWREINAACVEAGEFRLARSAGLHIIVNADELEYLVAFYEEREHIPELLELLESGLEHERAHNGLFTQLGLLYARHRPESLLPHLRAHRERVNVAQLIKICRSAHLWEELVFLHISYKEYDNAVSLMIERAPVAWDHKQLKHILGEVASIDLLFRVVEHYITQQPSLLCDLLAAESRLDPARVVQLAEMHSALPLIRPFLRKVDTKDIQAVNHALHKLMIAEGDHNALQDHVASRQNFDRLALARELAVHTALPFRRLAVQLYCSSEQWEQALELSMGDGQFQEAIEVSAKSGSRELSEALLHRFLEGELTVDEDRLETTRKECFAAMLFKCFEIVRPDVALELAWRHRLTEQVMPYMIQTMRKYTGLVDQLVKEREELKTKAQAPSDVVPTDGEEFVGAEPFEGNFEDDQGWVSAPAANEGGFF